MGNPRGGGGGGGKGKPVIASCTPGGIGGSGGGNHVGAFWISGFCWGGLVPPTSTIYKQKKRSSKIWQYHLLFQEEDLQAFGYHRRSWLVLHLVVGMSHLHLLSILPWVFTEIIPSESASLSTSPGNKAKSKSYTDDENLMSNKLTSFYVGHPRWCHTKWIHHRVIIDTTFGMPRKTILVEKISSFLSGQFRFLFSLFPSPVNKASCFRMLRNIFRLFLIYLL